MILMPLINISFILIPELSLVSENDTYTDNCNTIFGVSCKWCNISLDKNNESRFV